MCCVLFDMFFFFFKQKTAYEMRISDWSSDVCSSDLQYAVRNQIMLTGGSSSVRMFAQSYREAGAAARVLLCKAAAARWNVDWEACGTRDGFVVLGDQKLRFAELASEATSYDLPDRKSTRLNSSH